MAAWVFNDDGSIDDMIQIQEEASAAGLQTVNSMLNGDQWAHDGLRLSDE
jgi:hypothetical protein